MVRSRHVGRQEVALASVAGALDERAVVGMVVGNVDSRPVFEALYQDAHPVSLQKALSADDLVQATGAGPVLDGPEERHRGLWIVFALKQVEERCRGLAIHVVAPVFEHGDPSNEAAVSLGKEEVGVGVLVEWELAPVELQFGVTHDRRHPSLAAAIHVERHLYEAIDVAS